MEAGTQPMGNHMNAGDMLFMVRCRGRERIDCKIILFAYT